MTCITFGFVEGSAKNTFQRFYFTVKKDIRSKHRDAQRQPKTISLWISNILTPCYYAV